MSAQSIAVLTLTLAATAQVTAERFVGFDGAPAAAAGPAAGVSRTDAVDGDDFPVDVIGTAGVEAGGADGGEDEQQPRQQDEDRDHVHLPASRDGQ